MPILLVYLCYRSIDYRPIRETAIKDVASNIELISLG